MNINKRINGSMTVEAAVLFPIIIFILYYLFFITFYLHDIVTLEGVTNDILLEGKMYLLYGSPLFDMENEIEAINNEKTSNKEVEYQSNILNQYASDRLKNGFFILNMEQVHFIQDKNQLNLKIIGTWNIPSDLINTWMNRIREVEITKHIDLTKTSDTIRLFRGYVEIFQENQEENE